MTNVTVKGLMSARRKEARSAIEREHHMNNELTSKLSFIREDKAGRCYTYRGVSYCYQ